LRSTATYDVEPTIDVERRPILGGELRRSATRGEVEVDGGVRRLRIASLPSSSTLESRSTSSSRLVDVDIERHGNGHE
jgi:hypothetical protein